MWVIYVVTISIISWGMPLSSKTRYYFKDGYYLLSNLREHKEHKEKPKMFCSTWLMFPGHDTIVNVDRKTGKVAKPHL